MVKTPVVYLGLNIISFIGRLSILDSNTVEIKRKNGH